MFSNSRSYEIFFVVLSNNNEIKVRKQSITDIKDIYRVKYDSQNSERDNEIHFIFTLKDTNAEYS